MDSKESVKEQRIRKIALFYYSRQDIRKNMIDFAKNREIAPSYMMQSFGKRPDSLNYESDILELAKKGATSFHCSEEIWKDPLELDTNMSEEQLNQLRAGWDLLIDIDSKYFDYSKIYAEILIDVLKFNGIKHIGIKFSGSKGFHVIVPWKAFPKQMSGQQTKNMFPEWPRLICKYLNDKVTEELKNRILDINNNNSDSIEMYCSRCNSSIEPSFKISFICPACRTESQSLEHTIKRKRKIRCPNCEIEMIESSRQSIYFCPTCNIDSVSFQNNFKERVKTQHIDADIVLVSPRHLFRMPYSLHEKTSLASVVISKDKIKEFDIKDAHPLKAKPVNFIPDSEEGEASELLRQALEHSPIEEIEIEEQEKTSYGKKKFKDITITNLTPELYPPSVKIILKGMPSDGRKRALFILLNFFKSLKLPDKEIEVIINNWNKKNYEPLKTGYIRSQLSWYSKKTPKMPPNFDKSYYKEIGINPTQGELKAKNPVSYVIRKSFALSKGGKRNVSKK